MCGLNRQLVIIIVTLLTPLNSQWLTRVWGPNGLVLSIWVRIPMVVRHDTVFGLKILHVPLSKYMISSLDCSTSSTLFSACSHCGPSNTVRSTLISPQTADELRDRMQEVYDMPLASADLLAHAEASYKIISICYNFLISFPPNGNEIALVLRAILLLYTVTASAKVLRRMQLESLLPVMANLNSLVNAGTGSGKDICMVLPVLLDPTSITLVISPLKRLQMNQVCPFPSFSRHLWLLCHLRLQNLPILALMHNASTLIPGWFRIMEGKFQDYRCFIYLTSPVYSIWSLPCAYHRTGVSR